MTNKGSRNSPANALADIAMAQGAAAPVLQQLSDFVAAYQESPELRNFLASPAVNRDEKEGVVDKLAARIGLSKIVRNFVLVVMNHGRAHILAEILASFQNVLRTRQGIAEAEVSSAVELSAEQKQRFAQMLERITGKKIELKYSLNPTLLGGAVVRVGDTVYDGSLRNRLNAMRSRLVSE